MQAARRADSPSLRARAIHRHLPADRELMEPFTMKVGMPRDPQADRRPGHSSVSMVP